MFSYALGYVTSKSLRRHKFLRFIDRYDSPQRPFFWYEIYNFETDSWTSLDVVTPHWFIGFCDHGISLKGNTYWPTQERTFDDYHCNIIIFFDFKIERFEPLLPLLTTVYVNEYVTLSCVREEILAALFQHTDSSQYELEIWTATKIDFENVSWSKFLKFVTEPDKMVPYLTEGFFIDEEKKVALGFDGSDYPNKFTIIGEDGYVRELDFGVHGIGYDPVRFSPHVCSYVPSLVEIKNRTRRKRKKEDALEKLRFDQNMLRLDAFEKPNLIHNA